MKDKKRVIISIAFSDSEFNTLCNAFNEFNSGLVIKTTISAFLRLKLLDLFNKKGV